MATAIKTVSADVAKETSATTGTGTLSLAGAATGFQTLVAAIGDGNYTFYAISDGTDWEVGFGKVYDSTGHKLDRDKILASSNSDAAVSWTGDTVVKCVNAAGAVQYGGRLQATATTTDATPANLTLYGLSAFEVSVPSTTSVALHATIVARQTVGTTVGDTYTSKLVILAKNIAGTTTLAGTPSAIGAVNDAAFGGSVTGVINDTDDTVMVQVTGEASKTIEWTAFIEVYEV